MAYLYYKPSCNSANYGISVVYLVYISRITGIYAVYIQHILKHPWLIQGYTYSYFFFNSRQLGYPVDTGGWCRTSAPDVASERLVSTLSSRKPSAAALHADECRWTWILADTNGTVQSKAVLVQLGVSRMEKRIWCGPSHCPFFRFQEAVTVRMYKTVKQESKRTKTIIIGKVPKAENSTLHKRKNNSNVQRWKNKITRNQKKDAIFLVDCGEICAWKSLFYYSLMPECLSVKSFRQPPFPFFYVFRAGWILKRHSKGQTRRRNDFLEITCRG